MTLLNCPDEAGIRKMLKENNLMVDWIYSLLKKENYSKSSQANSWKNCNFSYLYRLITEVMKLKLDIFENYENSENDQLHFIMTEFYNPKKEQENYEYSKDKTNISEIIDQDDELHKMEMDDSEQVQKTNPEFMNTHFPVDFKHTLEEDHLQDEDGPLKVDKKEDQFDDLNFWKTTMMYSNKQIEGFIEKKEQTELNKNESE